jgi:hypothetical protein
LLLILAAWALLILAALPVGLSLLRALSGEHPSAAADRFFASVWLGIVVLMATLTAASLLVPLSPLTALAIAVASGATGLRPGVRYELLGWVRSLTLRRTAAYGATALVAAAMASIPVDWFDSGLYHVPLVEWLARYGAVPGLALVYYTFGWNPGWLTMAAPFAAGPFDGHTTTITGGLVLVLAAWQLSAVLGRLLAGSERTADWFVACSVPGWLPLTLVETTGGRMGPSPSPDVVVFALGTLTAWSMVAASEARPTGGRLLAVVFSGGATLAKLSAGPLFLVTVAYAAAGSGGRRRPLLVLAALSAGLVLPLLAFGVVTTGCPLYPAAIGCIDRLPWAVGSGLVARIGLGIHQYFMADFPPGVGGFRWFAMWAEAYPDDALLTAAMVIAVCLLLDPRRRRDLPASGWLVAASLLGTVLMASQAIVSWRYGAATLGLAPALLIANARRHLYPMIPVLPLASVLLMPYTEYEAWRVRLLFLGFLLVLYVCTLLWRDRWRQWGPVGSVLLALVLPASTVLVAILISGSWRNAVLPPDVPRLAPNDFVFRTVNGTAYAFPRRHDVRRAAQHQCWATTPPCVPGHVAPHEPEPFKLTREDIRVRDPERGMSSGFVRTSP